MNIRPRRFLASGLMLLGSLPAAAAPAETSPATPSQRAISPDLAAKLTASLPKFIPKKPPVETSGQNAPAASLDDLPQNGIIRLPTYEVQEKRLPYHSERDLLTDQGRLALALKRHPGFNFGPLKSWNRRRAVEWLADEQQRERSAEIADLMGRQRSYEKLRESEKPKAPPTK